MMIKMNRRLFFVFMLCLLFTQVACSQQIESTDSEQDKLPTPTIAYSKEPVDNDLRTDIIFDSEKYKDMLQIRFFYLEGDSKTGESMLITTPDGVNMLIDAGIKKVGPQVIDYLKNLEIEKLDYILASHFHSDHIGGLPSVIKEFEIEEVMMSEMPFNSTLKKELDQAVSQKNGNFRYLKAGDTFNLGDEVTIEVISPEPDMVIPEGVVPEEVKFNPYVNSQSIVIRMTYKNNSFLFPGDIFEDREKELMERAYEKLDVDVLKVPHHGTDTSSSTEFIQAVSPVVSVIGTNVGFSKNRYDKYRTEGSEAYITVVDGNILVVSDGENISAITEKDRIGSFLK